MPNNEAYRIADSLMSKIGHISHRTFGSCFHVFKQIIDIIEVKKIKKYLITNDYYSLVIYDQSFIKNNIP